MIEFDCPYKDENGKDVGICVGIMSGEMVLCDHYDICFPHEDDVMWSDEYIKALKEINERETDVNIPFPKRVNI